MTMLCLHCGGEPVTLRDVESVPVPERTKTWCPLPYSESIGVVRELAPRLTGREIEAEEYGLNRGGLQMFALLRMAAREGDPNGIGMSIGLRGSYDKSLANGEVQGGRVFVCDNLAFTGSDFRIMRKNTPNVIHDWYAMIHKALSQATAAYLGVCARAEMLKALPCPERRGYSLLGVAIGEKVITSEQANVAFESWRKPVHEEFGERNVWSFYNAITEGLKKGTAGSVIDRHVRTDAFIDAIVVPKCTPEGKLLTAPAQVQPAAPPAS